MPAPFNMRDPAPEYEVANAMTGERRKAWSGYFFWIDDVVGEDVITFDDPLIVRPGRNSMDWRSWLWRCSNWR